MDRTDLEPRWPPGKSLRFAIVATSALWLALGLTIKEAKAAPVLLPPPPYDQPFTGRTIIERLPDAAAWKECWRRGYVGDGCAWHFPDSLNPGREACHIIYPLAGTVSADRLARTEKHEPAHCLHWPANHPGGRY